ncbi:glycoside hydrolase family 97 protein [soil metagenome]
MQFERRYLLPGILLSLSIAGRSADTLRLHSPSGKISVHVWMNKQLQYEVLMGDEVIIKPSAIDFLLNKNRSLSANNSIQSSSIKKVNEQIISPVPEKRKLIADVYNQLSVAFKQPYKVEFRAYDDGVAYRILTQFKDTILVDNEVAEIRFPGTPSAWFPQVQKREDADIFHTSFEEEYPLRKLDSIPAGVMGYSPVLVSLESGVKIGLTESDLYDYPGMFIGGTGGAAFKGVFAPYPLQEESTGGLFPELKVTKRADYIAKTAGTRSFPWRAFLISAHDKELPGNDLVYRLAPPSRISDASWVKPGKLTDEWIIDINLFNVPFKAGLNTASYKFYIDFAKRFGFDRIMMDAGWSDNNDLFKINPNINMDTLVAYANLQGIKLSMWTLSMTLERQLDSALAQFKKWGVDFIMTDFMDRDDQRMVNFYYRVARACAENKIMIMYHGAFPPKGFNRTYPNAVAREGVLGSEFDTWSGRVTPGHDVTLPFTRMLAGGFDYEPGLLNNAIQKIPRPVAGFTFSPGTRCHQLAMFIVYDNVMQIFSGNPSEGMREPEFMQLLGGLPTAWDETIILDAKVGEYIISARKKGNNWFVAGMNDWTEKDTTIKLDFLGSGSYKATICKDGVNADRYAADYIIQKDVPVQNNDEMKIHLAPGGGFLIRLDKQ